MQTWNNKELDIVKSNLYKEKRTEKEHVEQFQNSFIKWQESKNCFTFQNARSALSFVLDLLNLTENDEVILSPYTCVVVYNAVLFSGAKPVFCDIELESLSLDYQYLQKVTTPKTKAIILPHLMGFVSKDLLKIKSFSALKNIFLIEDCAQSQGARLNNVKVGNFGNAAIFSFEYSKIMNTINGGAAIINDELTLNKAKLNYKNRIYCNKTFEDKVLELGFAKYNQYKLSKGSVLNRKFPDFKSTLDCEIAFSKPNDYGHKLNPVFAQIGIIQLEKYYRFEEERIKNAENFYKKFDSKINFIKPIPNSQPSYLRLPGFIGKNEKYNRTFKIKGHKIGYWYSKLLDPSDMKIDNMPNATLASETIINLPTLF